MCLSQSLQFHRGGAEHTEKAPDVSVVTAVSSRDSQKHFLPGLRLANPLSFYPRRALCASAVKFPGYCSQSMKPGFTSVMAFTISSTKPPYLIRWVSHNL